MPKHRQESDPISYRHRNAFFSMDPAWKHRISGDFFGFCMSKIMKIGREHRCRLFSCLFFPKHRQASALVLMGRDKYIFLMGLGDLVSPLSGFSFLIFNIFLFKPRGYKAVHDSFSFTCKVFYD